MFENLFLKSFYKFVLCDMWKINDELVGKWRERERKRDRERKREREKERDVIIDESILIFN